MRRVLRGYLNLRQGTHVQPMVNRGRYVSSVLADNPFARDSLLYN
jgi:hypothetical protein